MRYLKWPCIKLTIICACAVLLISAAAKAQTSVIKGINYLNDTTLDFNRLVNQFKGKVIYVDIWATWCSLCIQELRLKNDIVNFQKFAVKNNVVILYICCDGKFWKQFISANRLLGYHILENRLIKEDLHTTFSSVQTRNGKFKQSFYLPRHLIIDQNGAVVDSTAQPQGSAIVYSKIGSLLHKGK